MGKTWDRSKQIYGKANAGLIIGFLVALAYTVFTTKNLALSGSIGGSIVKMNVVTGSTIPIISPLIDGFSSATIGSNFIVRFIVWGLFFGLMFQGAYGLFGRGR